MKIFPELKTSDVFKTPKPTKFIEKILKVAIPDNGLVLDSFAGSGTTAHAVLNLNKQDGGNRQFILVEMEDYAESTTAERVKRVMAGYGEGKKAVEGTGGNFSYYTLGEPMFLQEGEVLNESLGVERICEYVWYTETRAPYKATTEPYLLGSWQDTAYYFYYEPEQLTILDEAFLRQMQTKAAQYILYADVCLLPKPVMDRLHIVFKKIPRDISRF